MTLGMKYDEWREEGLAEGEKQGAQKKALETAKNFLKMNFPADKIAQGTGLTLEQVLELQKELA